MDIDHAGGYCPGGWILTMQGDIVRGMLTGDIVLLPHAPDRHTDKQTDRQTD